MSSLMAWIGLDVNLRWCGCKRWPPRGKAGASAFQGKQSKEISGNGQHMWQVTLKHNPGFRASLQNTNTSVIDGAMITNHLPKAQMSKCVWNVAAPALFFYHLSARCFVLFFSSRLNVVGSQPREDTGSDRSLPRRRVKDRQSYQPADENSGASGSLKRQRPTFSGEVSGGHNRAVKM